MTAAVTIEGVTKAFGPQTAVDDLSLVVPARSIYGFIGPNGSGKTTTLRMIMRIIHQDRGRIAVLGRESLRSADDRVAYLPEERGLYKQMTVTDILGYYAALKGMREAAVVRKETTSWLERLGRLGLAGHEHKRISALSKGMAQKVQFIATVIARPSLLLLDEPFSGLDPVNAVVLREAILSLRKETTIIFSTHDMGVAEQMCDFIFMIHRGKKVLDGSLAHIQDAYGSDTLRIRLDTGADVSGLPGVTDVVDFGNLHELRLERAADPQRILAELVRRGPVRHFEQKRPSLHEIFVRIARDSGEGDGENESQSAHA